MRNPKPTKPTQLGPRQDCRSAERQIAFIEKLADGGGVSAACNPSVAKLSRVYARSRAR